MRLIHEITETLRAKRDGHGDPPAPPTVEQWRRRAALTSLQRDLDEAADEQVYIEAEIARSREYAERLDAEAAAAVADGCAVVAREIHEELNQTYAFLAELAEVHHAVITERGRLSVVAKHLADRLAEPGTPTESTDTAGGLRRPPGPKARP